MAAKTNTPAGAEVFCPDGVIGQTVNVTVTGLGQGLRCTVTYSFRDLTGVIAEKTQDKVISWRIPETFYNQIPEGREDVCTITCATYDGDVPVATNWWNCTVTVDESVVVPVLQGVVEDVNEYTVSLTGDPSRLVRYCSDARVTGTCEAKEGAYITLYSVTNGAEVYAENPFTVSGVEDGLFQFFTEDSRGCAAFYTVEAEMIPYIKLTCDLGDDIPDKNGNMTVKVSGNYYGGSFGAADNDIRVQYRFKEMGGEYGPWQDMATAPGADKYNATANITGLDYMTAYVFQARAMDTLSVAFSVEYVVRAAPVFDWDENDFNVNGTFKINDMPVADYVTERGTDGIWTWEKWAGGMVRCWGITAEKTFTFLGDGPVYYGNIIYSATYPFPLAQVDAVHVDVISDAGCVVPVVLTVNQSISLRAIRLFGGKESVQGRYSITVTGRWQQDET